VTSHIVAVLPLALLVEEALPPPAAAPHAASSKPETAAAKTGSHLRRITGRAGRMNL
jgi:hypothetical protein